MSLLSPHPSRAAEGTIKEPGTPRSAIRESDKDSPVPPSPLEEEDRLTKNWGGPRKDLSEKGVDIAAIYKLEWNRLLAGGVEPGSTEWLGNFDLRLSFDFEKIAGWKGTSAFLYAMGNHGGDPSLRIGDYQVTSNIEATATFTRIYEAWIQQLFMDGKVSLLAGLHDLNSEFYATPTSTLFFNSSFGVGRDLSQTGINGPSIFPVTSPALRLRSEPTKNIYLQTAIFNAVSGDPENPRGTHFRIRTSDGALIITEAAWQTWTQEETEGASGDPTSKVGLGTWSYTKPVDHLTQAITTSEGETLPVQDVNFGFYFFADHAINDTLAAFARLGLANPRVNPAVGNLALGVVFAGLLPGRDQDRFGIGYTRVQAGSEFLESQRQQGSELAEYEATWELNYRLQLLPGLALQPDFQWVLRPAFRQDLDSAKVLSARLELNF